MAEASHEFAPTRWTLVLRAKGDDTSAKTALSELCGAYYAPVVAFLRYRLHSEDAAREQAHAFFARLLEGQSLSGADPGRGRFRSYLLGALRNFLADAWDRGRAEKRGGGLEMPSLDESSDEATTETASDFAFDRELALTVINRALASMSAEAEEGGKREQFEVMKPALVASGEAFDLASAATRLNMNEGAVKVAVHRLRARFRDWVKHEIAQTVPAESDIDAELRYLVSVLSGRTS
jgi:DNA-directed RNA polymerase specialized sigma24 family protein